MTPMPAGPAPSLADLPLFSDRVVTEPEHHQSAVVAEEQERRDLNWAEVATMKRKVTELLDEYRRTVNAERSRKSQSPLPLVALEQKGRSFIKAVVEEFAESQHSEGTVLSWAERIAYQDAVYASQFGFGRLEPLFQIATAENITVNGPNSVMITHTDGRREKFPFPIADTDEELNDQVRQIGRNAIPARTLDATHSEMTAMVRERYRVHAVSKDVSVHTSVSIRQHHLMQVSLTDLVERGTLTGELADFLDAAVKANLTIVVAGAQGAGKTTLLRALINAIPSMERFATLETDLELFSHLMPGRENILAMHSRTGMGEINADGSQIGEIGVGQMVDMALRQGLLRIIVGEVRGAEASAMFSAMQVGAGTMCTTHSKDVETIADRLATRVTEGNVFTFEQAMRQVGLNVDLLIHVALQDETWRGGPYNRYVSRVEGCSLGDNSLKPIALQRVYTGEPQQNGIAVGELTPGKNFEDLVRRYRGSRIQGGGVR